MENRRREIIEEIFKAVLLAAFLGGVVFFASVLAFLGMLPLYGAVLVPVVGVAAIILIVILACRFSGPKLKRGALAVFCLILAGSAVYGVWGWHDSGIAELEERDNLLWKYGPFEEESLVATLDEEADLKFSAQEAESLRLDGATALYPVFCFCKGYFPGRRLQGI